MAKKYSMLMGLIVGLCLLSSGVQAQKMLLEDCNDANIAAGFDLFENAGFVMPNETDAQTWTFYSDDAAWGAWNDFANDSLMSPDFKASQFTVKYSIRNFLRTSQSEWDNVVVRITGLASNLDIYLGSSAANGELNPNFALYAEIQHPDKANGYIWDSKVNLGGAEVPSPFKDYIDMFPDKFDIEIVFRGPQQPLDIYYNFDDKGRTHLLRWNDPATASTFEQILAKDGTDTYNVALHANVGSSPENTSYSFDLDYFKIAGDIDSEFAVNDPEATSVRNWAVFE